VVSTGIVNIKMMESCMVSTGIVNNKMMDFFI